MFEDPIQLPPDEALALAGGDDPVECETGLLSLAHYAPDDPRLEERLAAVLASPRPELRIAGLHALAVLGRGDSALSPQRAYELAFAGLCDDVPAVRSRAKDALDDWEVFSPPFREILREKRSFAAGPPRERVVDPRTGAERTLELREVPASPREIGYDPESGGYVVFDTTLSGAIHWHGRTWEELTPAMKEALASTGHEGPGE